MIVTKVGVTQRVLQAALPQISQCAGAHKKPRWLPVAKSKIFRIPKRPVVSTEEKEELIRIHNNYKTQMRAIRLFYHNEMIIEKSSKASKSSEESMKLEAADWERCLAINDQWNIRVSKERDGRRAKQMEELEQYALERIEKIDRELQENIERVSKEIRKQKELSATFITPETLDAAIDQALATTTDYNFAIDLTGHEYMGRDTPPIKPKEETTPQL